MAASADRQTADLKMRANEGAGIRERAPAWLELRVPERPRMDHVRPDLQRHRHVGGAGRSRKTRGVCKQRLRRSHLDQCRREAAQISVKRGNARILAVHSSGEIRLGKLL